MASRVSVSAGPGRRSWDRSCHEVLALGQRIAGAGGSEVGGQDDWQLLGGHRDDPAGVAVDDRNRRPPRALARYGEVVGAIAHGRAQSGDRASLALGGLIVEP